MNPIRYTFIVHSRDRKDLLRKFPYLRYLPTFLFDLLTLWLPPFVVSRITGLKTLTGENVDGLIIGVPMTAHQLLERREKAVKKIIQAVQIGKTHGAIFIGLGAMTGSLTRAGKDIIENITDVNVTTGRTYTVLNILSHIEYCVNQFKLDSSKIRVAIVGAAGGIGSGTAIALARKGYKNFVLVDLERKLRHLKSHIEILENHADDLTIEISHQVSSIGNCHIIVAATSAPEVVITSKDVSPGSIIINDAQPSDISPDIITDRKDVIVIEGGVLNTPNIDCNFNLGLANKTDIFSCLAETVLLTYGNQKGHYSTDSFDANFYAELKKHSEILNFKIGHPQNTGGYIEMNHLQEFAKIIARRQD